VHHRLGHASSRVVQQVVSRYSLPVLPESNNDSVCDACQCGKSHQLPYPVSISVSDGPMDLIFSDVWVLPLLLLDVTNTIFPLPMTIANSLGSTCYAKNLKCFIYFMNFNLLLKASMGGKSRLYNLIGAVSIKH